MRSRVALAAALALLALAPPPSAADEAAVEVRLLRCYGNSLPGEPPATAILENQFELGLRCWGHIGTHTYFVGTDDVLALRGGRGVVTPAETGAQGAGVFVLTGPVLEPGVVVESSLDGRAWRSLLVVPVPDGVTNLARAAERLARQDLPDPPVRSMFQNKPVLHFELPDSGVEFRFLRLRAPMSATGGLSGYVDGSELWVNVTRVARAEPATRPGPSEFDCGAHILEDVFADHPCSFGATASYFDAPSFTHTYFLDAASRVGNASGSALLHPYRSLATVQQREAVINVTLETSLTGNNDWVPRGEFRAAYGVPAPFELSVDADARLVRLRAEPHALFASGGTRHFAGFLVSSTLVLDGNVPESARGTSEWSERAWTLHERAVEPPGV